MTAQAAEPSYAKPAAASDSLPPWYKPDISKYLVPSTTQLLTQYSHIPESNLCTHVHAIRDKAWAVRGYPCTGLGVFLVPWISKSPAYSEVLEKLKQGAVFLDIGCFIGYDMRQIVYDGAPSNNMHGLDIVSHWEIGHELFRDKDRFKAKFTEGDILEADRNPALADLRGSVDIIEFSAVMHQWDWNTQVAALKQVVGFSKIGTLLVGYQIGNDDGREIEQSMGQIVVKVWRQSPTTFQRLWEEVGQATSTKWEVSAHMRSWASMEWDKNDTGWLPPTDSVLDFAVRRVQ